MTCHDDHISMNEENNEICMMTNKSSELLPNSVTVENSEKNKNCVLEDKSFATIQTDEKIRLKELEKIVENSTTKRNASENRTVTNFQSGVTLVESNDNDTKTTEDEVMKNIQKFGFSGVEASPAASRTFFQNVSTPFIGSGFGSTLQNLDSYLTPSNANQSITQKQTEGFGTIGFGYFESNSGDESAEPKITSKNLAKKTKKKSTKKRYIF